MKVTLNNYTIKLVFSQGNQSYISIQSIRKLSVFDVEIFTWSVLQCLMIVYFGINLYDLHLVKKDVVYIRVDYHSWRIISIQNLMLFWKNTTCISKSISKRRFVHIETNLCLSAALSFDVHQVHMPNIFKSIIKLHVYNRWYIHSLVFSSWK